MPLLQGEIVLVPVPFIDLTSSRRRPVIVLSNNVYQATAADFVCVALTSNLKQELYSFEITSAGLAEGSLQRPSQVRADKIYTLSQGIVVARFGRVSAAVLDRIRQELATLTN